MLQDANRSPDATAELDVVSQIKLAAANRLPLLVGGLIGALVPIATYTVGHAELAKSGWASLPGAVVVGGCLFSALTVYRWGKRAFGSALKAVGFVVLSEGVMSFSTVHWLGLTVLVFLTAINAIANGANLAAAHLAAERRRTAASTCVAVTAPPPAILAWEGRLGQIEIALAQLVDAAKAGPAVASAVVAPACPAVATPVEATPPPGEGDVARPPSPRRRSAKPAVKVTRGTRRTPASAGEMN
jgi:hypothetical protein